MPSSGASKFAALSIVAALVTIALKVLAWWLTDSVGLLSDAIEVPINIVGATVALAMISVAARPPDEDHAFGYTKAEYFSSRLQARPILIAAIAIGLVAVDLVHHAASARARRTRSGRLDRRCAHQLRGRAPALRRRPPLPVYRARSRCDLMTDVCIFRGDRGGYRGMADRLGTGYDQWIHIDTQRAALESPYKTTIAHGFLSLSLLPLMMAQAMDVREKFRMKINYGLNRLRFPSPVPSGSRVRGHFRVERVEAVEGGVQVVWGVTVEVEGSPKPCIAAEWLSRYYR